MKKTDSSARDDIFPAFHRLWIDRNHFPLLFYCESSRSINQIYCVGCRRWSDAYGLRVNLRSNYIMYYVHIETTVIDSIINISLRDSFLLKELQHTGDYDTIKATSRLTLNI